MPADDHHVDECKKKYFALKVMMAMIRRDPTAAFFLEVERYVVLSSRQSASRCFTISSQDARIIGLSKEHLEFDAWHAKDVLVPVNEVWTERTEVACHRTYVRPEDVVSLICIRQKGRLFKDELYPRKMDPAESNDDGAAARTD